MRVADPVKDRKVYLAVKKAGLSFRDAQKIVGFRSVSATHDAYKRHEKSLKKQTN